MEMPYTDMYLWRVVRYCGINSIFSVLNGHRSNLGVPKATFRVTFRNP
jgi:hypothetical protein